MSVPMILSLEDYEAIAAAVMETERGRWFLTEFARRNRSADTEMVLNALAAVEQRLSERRDTPREVAAAPVSALPRIEAAAEEVARLRETLTAGADAAALEAALGQCETLGAAIESALEAFGVEPRATALKLLATPPIAVEADVLPEPVAVAAALVEPDFIEDADVLPAVEEPAAWADFVIEELAIEPEALQPEIEPAAASAPAPRTKPVMPAMPKAWTPGLLESLSDEEKAILFA